jgi:hypothetical protein
MMLYPEKSFRTVPPVIMALLLFLIVGCSARQKYLIPEKKFVNVLIDMHIADGIAVNNIRPDVTYILDSATLYGSVFEKYGVTRAMFDSTMDFYAAKPAEFQKIYDQVTARLKIMELESTVNADALMDSSAVAR